MQVPADWKSHTENYVFISDEANHAFINIDGKDLRLDLQEEKVENGPLRKGQRQRHTYRGERIEVVADYVVTWVCPPDCEVARLRNMTARSAWLGRPPDRR